MGKGSKGGGRVESGLVLGHLSSLSSSGLGWGLPGVLGLHVCISSTPPGLGECACYHILAVCVFFLHLGFLCETAGQYQSQRFIKAG